MLNVTQHDLVRFSAVMAPDATGEIDQGVGPIVDTVVTPVVNEGTYTLTAWSPSGTDSRSVELNTVQDPIGYIDCTNLEEDGMTVDSRVHPTFDASVSLPLDNTVVSIEWWVTGGDWTGGDGLGPITITPNDIDTVTIYAELFTAEGARTRLTRHVYNRPSPPAVNPIQTYPWDIPLGVAQEFMLRADDRVWNVSGNFWSEYPSRRFRIPGVPYQGMEIRVTLGFLDTTDGFVLGADTVSDLSGFERFQRNNYDFVYGESPGAWFIYDAPFDFAGDLIVEVYAWNDAKNGPFGRFSLKAEHGVWINGPGSLYQNETGAYFSVPDSPNVPKTWSTSDGTINYPDGVINPNYVQVDIHSYPTFTIQCIMHFPDGDYTATWTGSVIGM